MATPRTEYKTAGLMASGCAGKPTTVIGINRIVAPISCPVETANGELSLKVFLAYTPPKA